MRTWLVGVVMFILGGVSTVLTVHYLHELYHPAHSPGLESRWEATIYLPANLPDWETALAEFFLPPFDGATLGAPLEGLWRGQDGKLGREFVRPITVSFPPQHLAEFQARARALGKRLQQEAIYIRYERPFVELQRIRTEN
jgi:hypothetical protein